MMTTKLMNMPDPTISGNQHEPVGIRPYIRQAARFCMDRKWNELEITRCQRHTPGSPQPYMFWATNLGLVIRLENKDANSFTNRTPKP